MMSPHFVDFEVCMPPSDTVSALEFSPTPRNMLCAGSWDQTVRIWQVEMNGTTSLNAQCKTNAPVMDVSWSDDNTKIYICTVAREVLQWDLQSNQLTQIGVHEAGVRSCHWIRAPNYACLMTGSWDKTLKFWDTRSPMPMLTANLPERCYDADVLYPMAVVTCAGNNVMLYALDRIDYKHVESNLKQQSRCISLFREQKGLSAGFAIGGIEGRAVVHYLKDSEPFAFKCHSSVCPMGIQNIYAVNDLKHHPVHQSLITAGSDGVYMCWDTFSRNKILVSSTKDQPLTKCCFNTDGQIFAFAIGYDWAKGHEHFDPNKKPQIFLHPCFDAMKIT